jgi:hypothetical protein
MLVCIGRLHFASDVDGRVQVVGIAQARWVIISVFYLTPVYLSNEAWYR